MQKKPALTKDEEVDDGLHEVIVPRKIAEFIEEPARPHGLKQDLYEAYQRMAEDQEREDEALVWAEGTFL